MVSQVPRGPGEVLVALVLEQGDGDVSEDRQCSWCLAVSGLVFVLLEKDIPTPVQAVFYAPVAADPTRQLPRAGLVCR